MEAWLIYFREGAEYNRSYIEFYQKEGAKLGINVKLLLVEDLEFGVSNQRWYLKHKNQCINRPDFAICRAIYPLLTRQLELMKIPVFNNSYVSEICNDKARTCQYLASTGIKMVDTSFYRNTQIHALLAEVDDSMVIKAVEGHGGSQVFLTDRTKLEQIENGLGSSDVVVQPLTGSKNQDLRVYVIGKEIVAAVLRTAREGFKSNFSLGGEVRLYQLSEAEITIVETIIRQFEFGLVGIDFILGDEGELIFNEIEDVVGSRMLYQCSDINIVEKYLTFIRDTLKPL